jgi:hypothetical protein
MTAAPRFECSEPEAIPGFQRDVRKIIATAEDKFGRLDIVGLWHIRERSPIGPVSESRPNSVGSTACGVAEL